MGGFTPTNSQLYQLLSPYLLHTFHTCINFSPKKRRPSVALSNPREQQAPQRQVLRPVNRQLNVTPPRLNPTTTTVPKSARKPKTGPTPKNNCPPQ